MDQILWNEALTDGVSLFDICDNDSQGLHEAHVILTNGQDTFRPDLGIEEVTNHVLFLYGAVFHPAIHEYRQGILDTAFNLFGEESVALMWLETSGLTEAELAELGFKKIAGEGLIFRHSVIRTPFSEGHPRGQDADVEALPEWYEWVLQEWERFESMRKQEKGPVAEAHRHPLPVQDHARGGKAYHLAAHPGEGLHSGQTARTHPNLDGLDEQPSAPVQVR
jgi:hypothetical protein